MLQLHPKNPLKSVRFYGTTTELKMKTIVEGIEREEQINQLTGIGCKLGQGFYYSKPLSSKMFESEVIGKLHNISSHDIWKTDIIRQSANGEQ